MPGADALELNIYLIAADMSVSGAEIEEPVPGVGRGGQGIAIDSAGGQGRSLLQLAGPHGQANRRQGGRRLGHLQPASFSRTSTSTISRSRPSWS